MEAWNAPNAPERLQWDLVTDIHALPLQAKLEKVPWTDSYWPSMRGGIAARWNGGGSGFGYRPPSPTALKRMTLEQLKRLSPAEKYDVYVGRYDYPTVKSERSRTSPADFSWEGLCAGWAPASLHFDEPEPVVLEGANGVKVPFGSSDIKALLMYYQDKVALSTDRMLGLRCGTGPASSGACRDVNAGSFHILLSNYLGLRKQGFVVDITRGNEVWNHPVYGFTSRILEERTPSRNAAPGAIKELRVETTINYIVEIDQSWSSHRGRTRIPGDATKRYSYLLELNVNDEIIGGEWLTADRPDFAWIAARPEFVGYFSQLGAVYNAALAGVQSGPTSTPTPNSTPGATPIPLPTSTVFPEPNPTPQSDFTPTPSNG
jgi:hypothetical protein